MWDQIARGISEIGYALNLGGGGISRPLGSAYMPGLTPEKVYNTKAVVENKGPSLQDVANQYGSSGASGSWGTPSNSGNTGGNTGGNTQPTNNAPSGDGGNNNPGFQAPSGPSDEELNAIYNPIFSNLDAQQKALEAEKLKDLGMLDQSQVDAETAVAKQREANKAEYQVSQDTLAKQKESALSEAIRNYNALRQQSMARFGASSSAGLATNELAGQEFYRQQGNTQEAAIAELGKLLRQNTQANLFFDGEEARIRREAAAQKSEVVKQYTNALMDIETNRSLARSEQAARKLAERQKYNDALTTINNQMAANRLALETWKEQQSYLNSQAINKAQEDYTYSLREGLFPNEQTTALGPTTNTSQQYAYNFNPYARNRDEINDLLFTS